MTRFRRLSSDRSPPVHQQRQIASCSTPNKKSDGSSMPPSRSKQNPITDSNPNPSSQKKPLLVIGQSQQTRISNETMKTPGLAKTFYGEDVVGKKIRVYWPKDNAWYDGRVKSFDNLSGKHLILYDDGDEENLPLGKHKFQWVEEEAKSFQRLKRNPASEKVVSERHGTTEVRRSRRLNTTLVSEKVALDNDDADGENMETGSGGVDSIGEDRGNIGSWEYTSTALDLIVKAIQESVDNVEPEELDLVDEDEDNDFQTSEATQSKKSESRKRKRFDGVELNSGQKIKSSGRGEKIPQQKSILDFIKGKSVEPVANVERGHSADLNNILGGDVSERFGAREAEKLHFLGVGRMDAKKRRPTDVNYDPRTLYLPQDFLNNLSGCQRQWWEFKSKHMDKVLFFKVGKFYALFEMDAHIGVKELDLQYRKGEQPHCGFPEENFTVNVEKLTKKGYHVLVVDQTETPEQLEICHKENASKDTESMEPYHTSVLAEDPHSPNSDVGAGTPENAATSSNKKRILKFNNLGLPVGPDAGKAPTKLGQLVRSQVSVKYENWHKVPIGTKNDVWNDMKDLFNFTDTQRDTQMKKAAEAWKKYKAKLRKRLIGDDMNKWLEVTPDKISPQDWFEFCMHETSDEQKAQRERNKRIKNASTKKSTHNTGRLGYSRAEEKFMEENGRKPRLVELWLYTHKRQDGTYAPHDQEDAARFQAMLDVMLQNDEHDTLDKGPLFDAFGVDRGGRTRCVSSVISRSALLNSSFARQLLEDVDMERNEFRDELKSLQHDNVKLREQLNELVEGLKSGAFDIPRQNQPCTDVGHQTCPSESTRPPVTIPDAIPCQILSHLKEVVAYGMKNPLGTVEVVHGHTLGTREARVLLRETIVPSYALWNGLQDGFKTLGEVPLGSYLYWHDDLLPQQDS